jgi:hypothetical protein
VCRRTLPGAGREADRTRRPHRHQAHGCYKPPRNGDDHAMPGVRTDAFRRTDPDRGELANDDRPNDWDGATPTPTPTLGSRVPWPAQLPSFASLPQALSPATSLLLPPGAAGLVAGP